MSNSAPLGERTLVGFDLETTGVDPFEARIVTASLCMIGEPDRNWLADPGIEIPAGSTAVHGITTEHARSHGRAARDVVEEVACSLSDTWQSGDVVVIYNAAYDLRVVTEELVRHNLPPITIGPVLDPLVIWRNAERYRKGKKTLAEAVLRFGVELTAPHESAADATAAILVTEGLAELVPWRAWVPEEAAQFQQDWNREWADNFAAWLRDKGGDWESIDGSWPLGARRGAA
jgi:DNA polymerase-3 subunit epsilon